jgi:bifunctional non-homologous end joining protein LigD
MPLAVMRRAWDHPDWLWEIKYDGFRSLACVEAGACPLVSRKHAPYKAFSGLEAAILATLDHDAVLDGERAAILPPSNARKRQEAGLPVRCA